MANDHSPTIYGEDPQGMADSVSSKYLNPGKTPELDVHGERDPRAVSKGNDTGGPKSGNPEK